MSSPDPEIKPGQRKTKWIQVSIRSFCLLPITVECFRPRESGMTASLHVRRGRARLRRKARAAQSQPPATRYSPNYTVCSFGKKKFQQQCLCLYLHGNFVTILPEKCHIWWSRRDDVMSFDDNVDTDPAVWPEERNVSTFLYLCIFWCFMNPKPREDQWNCLNSFTLRVGNDILMISWQISYVTKWVNPLECPVRDYCVALLHYYLLKKSD